MRAHAKGTPREKRVMRTVARDAGGMSSFGFEKTELNVAGGRCWRGGGGGLDLASSSVISFSITGELSTLADFLNLSKSQAHPSPISPFLPAPRSSDSNSILLPLGLLSHSSFLLCRSSISHVHPASVPG